MKRFALVPALLVAVALTPRDGIAQDHAAPIASLAAAFRVAGYAGGLNGTDFRLVRTYNDDLRDGYYQDVFVTLRAGNTYRFEGSCDGDCTDLDLKLFGPNGGLLEWDLLSDDVPIVTHTAGLSATYRLRVIMANCDVNPCAWTVEAYSNGSDGTITLGPAPSSRRPAATLVRLTGVPADARSARAVRPRA